MPSLKRTKKPPAQPHVCNWGDVEIPIGREPYACGDPILSIEDPPKDLQKDTDGIYWMNTESKKMWFNLNGMWTHYNTNPI